MSELLPRITVCICTFQRANLLRDLLVRVANQETGGFFSVTIVIADNDVGRSAEKVTAEAAEELEVSIIYCVEPRQNIALARNRVVSHADGEFVAFIDDDEIPGPDWLRTMYQACESNDVAGVLGPVLPLFEDEPPRWLVVGKFYDRPKHASGHVLTWTNCRTGNVLMRTSVLPEREPPFREEFGSGGEDRDFFRRMIDRGHIFIWCNEGAVSEIVPPSRWKRRFLLKRALLRGKASLANQEGTVRKLLVSLVAVPLYAVALPFLLVAGHHFFMRYLIRLCDHAGRILAAVGLNPVRESYVTE